MSYFANELERLMTEHKTSAAEIARGSGITEASLSRIRNGVQVWVSGADIQKIAAAIDKSDMTHARLLHAHLCDELTGPGRELIDIVLRRKKGDVALREESPAWGVKLPPKIDAAMRLIAENIVTDADLRQAILGLANLYGKGTSSISE